MSTRSDTPSGPAAILCPAFQRGVVEEVLDGRSLTEALADVDGALRPAVQAVSFHAMRYLGWADAVGRELVQRYPNVLFESLLLVSLTLLKAEGEAAARAGHAGLRAAHGGGPGRDGRVRPAPWLRSKGCSTAACAASCANARR